MPVKFFLFADHGYPPYGTTMVARRGFADKSPDVAARFVKASLEGWKSYLAIRRRRNALIKEDNPKMSDEQIAFGIEQHEASSRCSTAATRKPWASASLPRRAGRRPTTT